jgi:hypothetical protein
MNGTELGSFVWSIDGRFVDIKDGASVGFFDGKVVREFKVGFIVGFGRRNGIGIRMGSATGKSVIVGSVVNVTGLEPNARVGDADGTSVGAFVSGLTANGNLVGSFVLADVGCCIGDATGRMLAKGWVGTFSAEDLVGVLVALVEIGSVVMKDNAEG